MLNAKKEIKDFSNELLQELKEKLPEADEIKVVIAPGDHGQFKSKIHVHLNRRYLHVEKSSYSLDSAISNAKKAMLRQYEKCMPKFIHTNLYAA
ncbi:MAG: hypothetical protein A2504_11670 [Bdellovibrionales bacterium RIFOXYD12_FULL_39_22]|nr:MAG: hypothetical protein A2385_16185 [Bdellovibrionales bacterium RIFOXYB1_FULL_39_21]OFZ44503.1 MAG: hypothetical protein A2485_06710 [Bdellovibrionales bacterium RIFOXYC12_FULL_39_17]OFZ49855.1 MAG: hypothetical protein A2404_00755 [Bdellovibrionales bacterium RIFOXYC1_FULL_39_130]OFZ76860.1 MAG: hypothetical protein A2560_05555 [Bdellovibrionales bacterium RIFOXYD1_FULL_39_84]OFZ95787.1 MAG: hypothetical protein A2504_11670 [Bdellovibrionales bacterium RIFOXYD12_FULL_39_22]HLE10805.1 hy